MISRSRPIPESGCYTLVLGGPNSVNRNIRTNERVRSRGIQKGSRERQGDRTQSEPNVWTNQRLVRLAGPHVSHSSTCNGWQQSCVRRPLGGDRTLGRWSEPPGESDLVGSRKGHQRGPTTYLLGGLFIPPWLAKTKV